MVKTSDVTLFGHTASECIAWKGPRPLQCVEFFAGVQSVHRAAVRRGLNSAAYDILCSTASAADVNIYDITSKEGFDHALELALSLEEGALMMLAPLCSSFSSTCKATHKRRLENDFEGDVSLHFVVEGNSIATSTAFLMIVGKGRNLRIVLENPPNSDIYHYPPMKEALAYAEMNFFVVVQRCAYGLGKNRIGKKFTFVTDSQWLDGLKRPCTCIYPHIALTKSFVQKDTGKAKHVGERRWTGNKQRLVESGAYPNALGECIVGAWLGEDLDALFAAPRVPLPALASKRPKRRTSRKRNLKVLGPDPVQGLRVGLEGQDFEPAPCAPK